MDRYLNRNRSKTVVAVLVCAQFVLLAYQVQRPDAGGIRLIRLWSERAILPVERATQNMVASTSGWLDHYVALQHAERENHQLESRIAALKLQNDALRESVRELPQLQALLGFQRQFGLRTVAAQNISRGASADAQAIYIDRGANAGLVRNMAVITPDGVVGKVSQVLSSSAQVLLVTDPDSGVGALIGAAGVHGILRGLGGGRVVLRNVLKDEPTPIGAPVVTSGDDQVFPKGVPIGTVTGARPSSDGVLKTIEVKLAANLGQIEQVLVVTGTLPAPADLPDTGLTAADIRQAKLPALPAAVTTAPAGGVIAIPTPPGAPPANAGGLSRSPAAAQASPSSPAAAPAPPGAPAKSPAKATAH